MAYFLNFDLLFTFFEIFLFFLFNFLLMNYFFNGFLKDKFYFWLLCLSSDFKNLNLNLFLFQLWIRKLIIFDLEEIFRMGSHLFKRRCHLNLLTCLILKVYFAHRFNHLWNLLPYFHLTLWVCDYLFFPFNTKTFYYLAVGLKNTSS